MAAMSAVEDSDPGATGDAAPHQYQPPRRAVNPPALPASRVELLGVGGAPDEPTGLQLVAGQALSGHRHCLDPDPQIHAHRLLDRGHHRPGLTLDLEEQAHLVELAAAIDLDHELVDRGEAAHDALERGGEHVDAPDDQHVLDPPQHAPVHAQAPAPP